MLLSLAQWLQSLSPEYGFFRVFQYITFRAVMAAVTALLIGLFVGPFVIERLRALKIGQQVRSYGMDTHLVKSGTPTMGGVLILMAIASSTLLWSCLLYTSDAADDLLYVDLGGRRIIKNKKKRDDVCARHI